MKKTLVFLLLVCISLFTLTGCGKGVSTKKLATEEEIEDFFDDKSEALADMLEDEVSLSFTVSVNEKREDGADSYSTKTNVKGRLSADPEEIEDASLYVEATLKGKGVEYTSEGKVKSSSKGTTEITVVGGKIYTYIKSENKTGESKTSFESKTKGDFEDSIETLPVDMIYGYLENIDELAAMLSGTQIYIEDDKCLIVISSTDSHTEIVLEFDGDELLSVDIFSKTYEREIKASIEIEEDIKKVTKPSDASSYKSE